MALTEQQKAERKSRRDLEAALSAEARAHREEANHREWDEKDLYLTEEQIAAGESCRGCGLPEDRDRTRTQRRNLPSRRLARPARAA